MYLAVAGGNPGLYQPDGTARTWGAADGSLPGMPTPVVEDGQGHGGTGAGRTPVMKGAPVAPAS
ncbi:MAG: hypothetical protein IPL96_17875 [Holophagaceae bacterium]|nr:hypothetical protein [Holophagaceae bacterium]